MRDWGCARLGAICSHGRNVAAIQTCFDVFEGGEKCERWFCGFDEQMGPKDQNNECYQTGGVTWVRQPTRWPFDKAAWCPGHVAIQVTMCDGTVFYLDSGFWGGLFPPGEHKIRDPRWCPEITPIVGRWTTLN